MDIITIGDMYRSFLKGINKKHTASVWPTDFNVLINESYQEYLRAVVDESDLLQKRMDDLNPLKYITDGTIQVLISTETIDVVGGEVESDLTDPVTGIRTVITIDTVPDPDQVTTTIYQVLIPITPVDINLFTVLPVNYPTYYRLQSIQATLTLDGVDYGYIGSKPLRSDRRSEVLKDPYKKPYLDIELPEERSRIYHQYIQDRLHLVVPDGCVTKNIMIEYIKEPDALLYDANTPANNVDCELGSDQQKQIVDIAVRKFIENIESPRYQSVLAEDKIKEESK